MGKKNSDSEPSDGSVPEVEPTRTYGTGLGSSRKDETYTESHPSYGMIRVGRTHGSGGRRLFGSPIENATLITLEICEGVVNRDLARDWYHARGRLIEVAMSPAQFAELITNMNVGDGVPCTLEYVLGKRRPDCPQRHQREEIVDEFKSEMKNLAARVKERTEAALAILDNKDKKTLTVADRSTIRAALDAVARSLTDSVPFIHSQFDEAMDKTVNAAKAELSAAAMTIAHSMGLEQMQARFANSVEGSDTPPALPPAGGVVVTQTGGPAAGGGTAPEVRDDGS